MRAPAEPIHAPPFPRAAEWLNVASLRMDKQRGRPVLIEFFDICRANSMRTLPYVKAWHARYDEHGLRVVQAHCPGFEPSRDPGAVGAALARLEISHPVLLDHDFELWRDYGNEGWPARYLWNADGLLVHYHHGEGAYAETELAIAAELRLDAVEPIAPLRPEDAPGIRLVAPTPERNAPPWSGPYQAGGVWAVLDGAGSATANGHAIAVAGAGAYPLIEHERHTAAELQLELGDGVRCHALTFVPGAE